MTQMKAVSELIVKQSNLIAQTNKYLTTQNNLLSMLLKANETMLEAYKLHMEDIELIKERLHESRETADNGSTE